MWSPPWQEKVEESDADDEKKGRFPFRLTQEKDPGVQKEKSRRAARGEKKPFPFHYIKEGGREYLRFFNLGKTGYFRKGETKKRREASPLETRKGKGEEVLPVRRGRKGTF